LRLGELGGGANFYIGELRESTFVVFASDFETCSPFDSPGHGRVLVGECVGGMQDAVFQAAEWLRKSNVRYPEATAGSIGRLFCGAQGKEPEVLINSHFMP